VRGGRRESGRRQKRSGCVFGSRGKNETVSFLVPGQKKDRPQAACGAAVFKNDTVSFLVSTWIA
jgi:hypothetical protein